MPEILHQASDDQLALAICFGAVVVSGLIMHFSLHVGRLTGRIRLHQTPEQGQLVLQEARVVTVRERAA
jgi:hypothetical protein